VLYLSLLWQRPSWVLDNGPIYYETLNEGPFREPWNAFSSLLFLLPVVYFMFRLKGKYRTYWFLSYFASPLLAIGGIGSTLFHGFRTSNLLLWMDWLPILVLTFGLSILLWARALGNRWAGWISFVVFLGLSILVDRLIPERTRDNVNYVIRGVYIFLPALIMLRKLPYVRWLPFIYSLLLFAFALWFRFIDSYPWMSFLPMGTHFLWHLCCALAAWHLGLFVMHSKIIGRTN
jgi:hypothetical protein